MGEGFGCKINEAMTYGTLVNISHMAEFIPSEITTP